MTVYQLLKANQLIKNHRIKFLGLWLLNLLNKRSLSVYFDPVLACNLRCKMCYFTDQDYVSKLKGIIPENDLELYAKAFFKNALKLQIGCGAEPTLYKNLSQIIALGKKYKVPYISLTTNGNLLNKEKITELSNAGLNEITLSLHGVSKKSYEFFMSKGNYENFLNNLKLISSEKQKNPDLKLRINYTFNKDNFEELEKLFDILQDISLDILQLRPIQKIGETEYSDFDLRPIETIYTRVLDKIKSKAKEKGITLLSANHLNSIKKTDSGAGYLIPYTYCYVSPNYCWKDNFNVKKESFSQWSSKNQWKSVLFANIFKSKQNLQKEIKKGKLEYSIDIN